MKLKVYPGLILSFCLGLLLVGVVWFQLHPHDSPQSLPSPRAVPVASRRLEANPSTVAKLVTPPQTGKVRVGNQTDVPIRLALLTQALPFDRYHDPAHWDFAPGEGDDQGVTLALPNSASQDSVGVLQVASGDILIAFAVDGSREYWGPYVVGKTDLPIWDVKNLEWRLILRED